MHRILVTLLVPLLLCACDPERNPQAPGPVATGSDSVWLVLTSGQGESETTSHSFVQWDGGPGLCSVMRSYYEGTAQAYEDYEVASGEFQGRWGDVEGAEQDPEYRRDYCEFTISYYSMFYGVYEPFGSGRSVTSLTLGHLGADDGAPVEGTYLNDAEEEIEGEGAAEGWFSGSRIRFGGSYSEYLADAVDCDAYAADPDAEMFAEPIETGLSTETYQVIGGSLDASPESNTAWRLTLTDGIEADLNGSAEVEFTLEGTFERCDVTYNWGTVEG